MQTGGVGEGGDDGEGFAAVFGVELLLDGREEAVEVDVEEGEAVGMDWRGHEIEGTLSAIIFAFYSLRLLDLSVY